MANNGKESAAQWTYQIAFYLSRHSLEFHQKTTLCTIYAATQSIENRSMVIGVSIE